MVIGASHLTTRRAALLLAALAACLPLVACTASTASQSSSKRIPTIGYLTPGGSAPSPFRDAFEAGLKDLGYVPGTNVNIEYRGAGGDDGRLPQFARDLVGLQADVIVATSSPAVIAAKEASDSIPIVMVAVGDPIGTGLVPNLARPGANVTGLTVLSSDVAAKRLEIIQETLPDVQRIAVLGNLGNPAKLRDWQETQEAAGLLGVQVDPYDVRDAADVEPAFRSAVASGAGALVVFGDPLTVLQREKIAGLALETSMPTMFDSEEFVQAGGLMAYGTSRNDLYRRAATYVDRVLKGAKAGDLPVEQPTKFDLVINLGSAAALGVTVPESVLLRADQILP